MRRKNALFLVFYVPVMFALLEGLVRVSFMVPVISSRLWGDDDVTWRRQWIERHGSGIEIYYAFDVFDPALGWRPRPNIKDMTVFGNKILNTNSKGLRGTTEYAYEKDPDKTRVLIVGDSFTFGDEVSDDETYAHYLQTMLPGAEVINMGVHGYGHDQMLLLIKEEGLKYEPDVVIIGFLAMDMPRNLLRFRDYAKPRFVLDDDALRLTGSPVPHPDAVLKWEWVRPRLYDMGSLLTHRLQLKSGYYEREMTAVTSRILDEMAATIEQAGAVPLFAYLPDGDEITGEPARTAGEDFLFAYCQDKRTVHCVTARARFVEKLKQGVRFKTTAHWDPAGHLTVAEAIHEYLAARDLVPLRWPARH